MLGPEKAVKTQWLVFLEAETKMRGGSVGSVLFQLRHIRKRAADES